MPFAQPRNDVSGGAERPKAVSVRNVRSAAGLVLVTAIAVSGCAQMRWDQADKEMTACVSAVNANPAFADLARRMPMVAGATPSIAQMANPAMATPHEVELLSARRDALLPCREHYITAIERMSPAQAAIRISFYAEGDANLLALAKQQISWGEYLTRNKRAAETGRAASLDVADVARRENANRAALLLGSGILNQPPAYQQPLPVAHPVASPVINTTCMRAGAMVSCTSQ